MSEPRARGASPAATAAAAPPELPPGTRSRSQGLAVWWKAEFSVEDPIANSSMLRRPHGIAPASFSLRVTVASYGETKFASIRLEHVSGWPATAITSLKPTGRPSSAPRACPAARRASEARAWASASASSKELNARTRSSTARVRAMSAWVSSTEESCFAASKAASSAAGLKISSESAIQSDQ